MGTKVDHDISETFSVRYCLHGQDAFGLYGVMPREHSPVLDFVADLTPEQATQLRHHLTVWLEAR